MIEKEKRIKEGMKIMGLKGSAFYYSWFITYFIKLTFISLLISIILKATFFTYSAWIFIFLWHWMFAMSGMALGFCITTLCSRAKVANVATFVYAFSLGWLQTISGGITASQAAKFWTGFGQPTSVSLALGQIVALEQAELGLNSETVTLQYLNYEVAYHYIWMIITFFFYLTLAWYFEQVLPSEFGVPKHPLFCFKRSKKESKRVHTPPSDEEHSSRVDSRNFEATDPALLAQDSSSESIQVTNLSKVYPNGKLAVN
jgi:ATP-binding cassette subfamily A (ABC1) protein 3